jgi:alpha,alpha-trehalase
VPHRDEDAYEYLSTVADRHPDLRISVVRLPEVVTPEWVRSRNGRHGLLSLALTRSADGGREGKPFVVPGGRFNEMYGWDSYFETPGLMVDGRVDLAKAMVDNFVYEIEYYGKILNANRSYYLTRSEPPFLTSMALAVYRHLPDDTASVVWLRNVFRAAIKEYREVWIGEARLTKIGLSRYYGSGIGPPPEVEPGHCDAVYAPYAERLGMTVDLNSLLYKIELDIAQTIERQFADSLALEDGSVERGSSWYRRVGDERS